MNGQREITPAHALRALAVGHTIWGVTAYRDQLGGIVAELPFSLGDGIFEKRHSRDARASAFWFLFAAPLLLVSARLYESAECAGDHSATRAAGLSVTAISVAGMAAFRASGFPAGLVTGLWMLARSR